MILSNFLTKLIERSSLCFYEIYLIPVKALYTLDISWTNFKLIKQIVNDWSKSGGIYFQYAFSIPFKDNFGWNSIDDCCSLQKSIEVENTENLNRGKYWSMRILIRVIIAYIQVIKKFLRSMNILVFANISNLPQYIIPPNCHFISKDTPIKCQVRI